MTVHHILALFLRIAALWLLVTSVNLTTIARWAANESGVSFWYGYVVPPTTVFIAILLWQFPRSIANCLLKPPIPDQSISGRDVAAAGSVIVGCSVLINLLPQVMMLIADTYVSRRLFGDGNLELIEPLVFATVMEYIVGLILLTLPYALGSRIATTVPDE